MMQSAEIWLTPLLLMPGVALLIMSTSARYGQIHAELHHLIEMRRDRVKVSSAKLLTKRSTLFRNAMVSLYVSVGLLSLAGLLGGLMGPWKSAAFIIVWVLTSLAILCLLFAAIELIRESRLSLDIIQAHSKHIETEID
jgi:hypothetical protein